MIPTPRMKTTIRRDKSGLFAVVDIEHEGKTGLTTMDPDVKASDLAVENFKRAHFHLPRIREDA